MNSKEFIQKRHISCMKCIYGSLKNLKNYDYNPVAVCNQSIVKQIHCRKNNYCFKKWKNSYLKKR